MFYIPDGKPSTKWGVFAEWGGLTVVVVAVLTNTLQASHLPVKIQLTGKLILASSYQPRYHFLVQGKNIYTLPTKSLLKSPNLLYVSLTRGLVTESCPHWLDSGDWLGFPYQKQLRCWLSQVSCQKKVLGRENQNNYLRKKLNE